MTCAFGGMEAPLPGLSRRPAQNRSSWLTWGSSGFILKNAARYIGVRTFRDPEKMLNATDLDFVVMAIPTASHAEMRTFKGLNVKAIFPQNIVTDLLLGLKAKAIFIEFASHVRSIYGVDPVFNTMNMARLLDFLLGCGMENPIVCSAINKIGCFMHPDRSSYEETIRTQSFRPTAMSTLASGALSAKEAVQYVAGQKNIRSIVFGASSRGHILNTKKLVEKCTSD